jgi:predicted nicotinamide N-methyase
MRQAPLKERILELGCGLSLPGLVLAKRGQRVTVSDYHPDVPEFLRRNLKLNHLTSDLVEFVQMDWRTTQPRHDEFVTILASDVLYDRQQATELLGFLERFRKGFQRLIVADPGRPFLQTFQTEIAIKFKLNSKITIEKCQSLHLGQEIWILDVVF